MPTVFRHGNLRFFFFSREEARMHIHVTGPDGEAKYWLEPTIELAMNKGLSASALKTAEEQVKMRSNEISEAWHRHFG